MEPIQDTINRFNPITVYNSVVFFLDNRSEDNWIAAWKETCEKFQEAVNTGWMSAYVDGQWNAIKNAAILAKTRQGYNVKRLFASGYLTPMVKTVLYIASQSQEKKPLGVN